MYTSKRLDEEYTTISKRMCMMGSTTIFQKLCEEAQPLKLRNRSCGLIERIRTFIQKSFDSSANKSKMYQTYVHHNIRKR